MDIHDSLASDHHHLRTLIEDLRRQRQDSNPVLDTKLHELKTHLTRHFAREEVYYRMVDFDKRFDDRGLIHQLRNDHAALIFGMESLLIRLRNKGPVTEWWDRFENLITVLLPHMDHEEKALFPEAERLLTAEEWQTIRAAIATLESAS